MPAKPSVRSYAADPERAISRSGHTVHQLRIDIATGEKSSAWIRKQYGLTVNMYQRFCDSEADNIAAIGNALANKEAVALRGLWSSSKAMRIAEMERDVTDINETIDFRRDSNGHVDPIFGAKSEFTNLLRVKVGILRSIADEIDGTRRALVAPEEERQVVRYVIEGKELTGGLT